MNDTNTSLFSSLNIKLGGTIAIMLLLALITVSGTFLLVQQRRDDAIAVNISGRQRMLSQRITKFALLIGQGDEAAYIELATAADLYESSLRAMIDGNEELGLEPASSFVRPQLDVVSELWTPFYADVQILTPDVDAATQAQIISNIVSNNELLLVESDRVVQLYETESNENTSISLQFLYVIVALNVIIFGAGIYVIRKMLRQAAAISDTFAEIETGNYEVRTDVYTRDELGQMAHDLNQMLNRTLVLIQSETERDRIQESIIRLLDEVADVAEGDLTSEANVTEDITGAIADSFNFMIEQLRHIIMDVQAATLQVSSSANEIQTTAEHLAQGSDVQATQIVDTSAAIDEMSVSIQQVSESAIRSAEVANQALHSAQQGTLAVHDTIEGMNRIREQGQETAKRIKRLGESSQEIGEIVQVIRDIAKRTSLLALNASLEAAAAGEAGRGFAVVAEDVKRLSQRSANATLQIAELIQSIQTETNAAVSAMEATTREVVEGSTLSNEAGTALAEIETISNQLAELIQSISLAAKQQARGSENIARSMNDIAEVTQQTAAGTKQAAVSISNLANLAEGLRGSVSAFRLPSGNGHSVN